MRLERHPLVHPLLFAIYPILHLYAANVDRASFRETVVPLAVSLVMTIVLFLGLKLVFKDGYKASLLTSATLILFFSYGHFWRALEQLHLNIWARAMEHHGYSLLLWFLLLLLAGLLTLKAGSRLPTITTGLNLVSAVLIALLVVPVGLHTLRRVAAASRGPTSEPQAQFAVAETPPDIYYIILDGYAREDILRDSYGYDNSEFIAYLTGKGFYVASRSRSNYAMSDLSLASSLNMDYLNHLSVEVSERTTDRSIAHQMLMDNRVWRELKGAGYRYLHFSSGYGPTDHNRFADVNYSRAVLNDFRTMLLETTVLNPLVSPVGAAQKRARTLFTLETMGKISKMEEPTYAFAHLMVPHSPFVFDRECGGKPDTQTGSLASAASRSTEYVDQLICVNRMVEQLVDEILANSETPPIIILQADHGWESSNEWAHPTEGFLKERMSILNAYYLPGDGRDHLYPSITPVNSFRVIFDSYFGTDLGLLEDRSYFSAQAAPYEFTEVRQ